jgi:predicted nucleotidyltransferase
MKLFTHPPPSAYPHAFAWGLASNGEIKIKLMLKPFTFLVAIVRGDYIETSDIDVVVVSDSWKNIPFLKRMDILNEIIRKERIRKVEAIPVTKEELNRKDSILLKDASKYWIRLK